MTRLAHQEAPRSWAEQHFGGLKLGDVRLSRRAIRVAAQMATYPGHSIPQLFDSWGDTKAAYSLFAHPAVSSQALQKSHRELVHQQLSGSGVYLLLEDTSELSWSGQNPIEGLGPIGSGAKGLQGFHLHSVLALRWPASPPEPEREVRRPAVELLGLAEQLNYRRRAVSPAEKLEGSTLRKARSRESQLWEKVTQRLGSCPELAQWIRVCDRGADIYEFLRSCQQAGHDFIVRAAQNRRLEDPQTGQRCGRLFETARAAPVLGSFSLKLRTRGAHKARRVQLNLCVVEVLLQSPQRPGRAQGYDPAIACTVVRVYEPRAPQGAKALEWILLCSAPTESFEQARERVHQYATRWVIEEFHKGLKTGLGAERLQLKHANNLFAAIAIMSVVALRLIHLREMAVLIPQAPAAESGLEATELSVLQAATKRPLHTVQDVVLALGQLGGHLGRKGDGVPGWIVLWRGTHKLKNLVEGFLIAKDL